MLNNMNKVMYKDIYIIMYIHNIIHINTKKIYCFLIYPTKSIILFLLQISYCYSF